MSTTQITPRASESEQRVAMRFVPKDSRKIEHDLGVCYVEDKVNAKGVPVFSACAYVGTARKSAFYYSYRTAEARDKQVADFFAGLESHQAMLAQRRADRSKPHTLKVGDIITNSWGYDQTNVDMYQIVKTTKNYVWLQPIASEEVPSEGFAPMSAHVRPALPVRQILTREVRDYNDTTGHLMKTIPVEPKMHKAEGDSVCFEFGCGNKWDGRSLYCSWYA